MSGSPSAIKQVMGPLEWGMLLLLGAIWGGSFYFAKIAVDEMPPLTAVFGRVLLAALFLNLVVRLSGQRWPADRRLWRALVFMGLINNVIPFSLVFWGQTQIAAGLASILIATTPIFTVLIAHLATSDEKLTPPRLAGALIGVAGVAVMIGPDVLLGGGATLAKLAVIGAALAYALSGVWARRFRGVPPLVAASGQLSASAVLMVPLIVVIDRPWTLALPSAGALWAVLALAVLSTGVGYLLFFTVLGRAGATNVSLVTLLMPASALLLGYFFLEERLAPRDLLGLAIIVLGLAAIDGRLPRWLWTHTLARPAALESS
jgi:drug/metabolite transporter (DMT)-like permease